MSREDPNVSWSCIYRALYLQSCTQEILKKMVFGFHYSNCLYNYQVQHVTRISAIKGENGKRVLQRNMAPTQTWRETWGPPIVNPHEDHTGPNPKSSKLPLVASSYVWVEKTLFTYIGIVQNIFKFWGVGAVCCFTGAKGIFAFTTIFIISLMCSLYPV